MPDRDPRLRAPDGTLNMIGQRVKARRKILKLRQADLVANIATVTGGRWTPSRIDITRIESGLRSCIDTETVAISAALNVDLMWLMSGEEQSKEGVREAVRLWQQPHKVQLGEAVHASSVDDNMSGV